MMCATGLTLRLELETEVTVVEQGLQGDDWSRAAARPAYDDLSCRAGAGCIRRERRRYVHVLLSCKPGTRPRLRTSSF